MGDDINGAAGDALMFEECDVINTTFRYFGDVTGQIGNTFGLTQNGSRSIGSRFLVEDPKRHVPEYSYRDDGDGYRFSWYGSFPAEWGSTGVDYRHLDNTFVQYIRDMQIGSVNISHCTFSPWTDKSNPIFSGTGARSTANPPSIELYNMESVSKLSSVSRVKSIPTSTTGRVTYGCNVSDSVFYYIWDVDVLLSTVSRSSFRWSAAGLPVPAAWTGKDPNPSFWVNLQSNSTQAGYPRTVNDTLVCMRPAIHVNGTVVPEQNLTITADSTTFRSHFLHTTDPLCRRPSDGPRAFSGNEWFTV